MIVSLSEVIALKNEVEDRFSVTVHFCDSCGGQHFTVERSTEEMRQYIKAFFAAKGLNVAFSENGKHFTVNENTGCAQ